MRIIKFHTQLDDFYRPFKFKYKVVSYNKLRDTQDPVVFFGCYMNGPLAGLIKAHEGLIVIVWAGSDSMDLKGRNFGLLDYFHKNKHRIFHIAYSHWIKADLDEVGLDYFEIPIFPVEFDPVQFRVVPLGENVYHYTSPMGNRKAFYGTDTVESIMKRVSSGHVLAGRFIITNANAYPREKLHEVYAKCFVGVRLTTHDNMAISCVEMALMGRRSIFNGNIPGAIPFKDRSEVYDLIMEEYQYSDPDELVAKQMWELINLDQQQWLDTDFYK